MANRVTSGEVKQIIDVGSTLTDPEIVTYVDVANTLVTDMLGDSTVLSSTQLKQIELFLSAHLIAVTRVRQIKREGVEEAVVTYHGSAEGSGLDASTYGQTVKILDTSGILARKLGKKEVYVHAITSFE